MVSTARAAPAATTGKLAAMAAAAADRPQRERKTVKRAGFVRSDDPSLSFAQPKGGMGAVGGVEGVMRQRSSHKPEGEAVAMKLEKADA